MKNSTILLNSCETDLSELRKDIEAGVYVQNVEGFTKEIDRIARKMADAREEVLFEREREQAEAEERLVEEAGEVLAEKIGKPAVL